MLAIFRNLVLALQVWAIASVRAQTGTVQQPPFQIVIVSRTDSKVCFECRETASQFKFNSWVLYRNGAPENTTDPCISAGNYSNGLLMISSECDGFYSCGVEHTSITDPGTTGLVLTKPMPVYATPIPIEAGMQSVNACVGETVFLPSFMPVSPLGNNEVMWFRVQNSGTAVPAENGIVTANYSYNLVSVSTLDAGTYFAEVKAPGRPPKNGPSVVLTIAEKPGIDLIEVVDGIITVTVTPHDAEFEYEWRFNGIISEENGQTFSLSSTVNENDQIEFTVYSLCGASVTATIYILTIPTASPSTDHYVTISTASPGTDHLVTIPTASPEVGNSSVCFEKSPFIAITVTAVFIVSLTCTILLCCTYYCASKKRIKQVTSDEGNGHSTQHPSAQKQVTSNEENGHSAQHPSNTSETNLNYQASPECLSFAKEWYQLCYTKLQNVSPENDDPYVTCLIHLLVVTRSILSKKELPKKIDLVPSDVKTDAPQSKESLLGMDGIPEQFRAELQFCCMELGIPWNIPWNIPWKENSDVHKSGNMGKEPDPKTPDNKKENSGSKETAL